MKPMISHEDAQIERFRKEEIAAHVTLKKGERSELATKAAKLL